MEEEHEIDMMDEHLSRDRSGVVEDASTKLIHRVAESEIMKSKARVDELRIDLRAGAAGQRGGAKGMIARKKVADLDSSIERDRKAILHKHNVLRAHGMAPDSIKHMEMEGTRVLSSVASHRAEAGDDALMRELEQIAELGLPSAEEPSTATAAISGMHGSSSSARAGTAAAGRSAEEYRLHEARRAQLQALAQQQQMRASLPTRPVAPLDTDDAFLEAVEGAPEGHLVLVCLHDETVDECRRLAVELPRLAGQLPSATVFLARCSAVAPKFDPIALPALVAYQNGDTIDSIVCATEEAGCLGKPDALAIARLVHRRVGKTTGLPPPFGIPSNMGSSTSSEDAGVATSARVQAYADAGRCGGSDDDDF